MSVADPFDDPFGEYEPSIAFAMTAARMISERSSAAKDLIEAHLAQNRDAENIYAASARKSAQNTLSRLEDLTRESQGHAEQARVLLQGGMDPSEAVDSAIQASQQGTAVYDELSTVAAAMLIVDPVTAAEPPLPPLPAAQDWTSVTNQVQQDTLAWGRAVRGAKGKLLILKPSPSCGKTRSMALLALQEQAQRQRVVFTAKTKEIVEGELRERIDSLHPFGVTRLHVIQGRDDKSCLNWDNVKTVQEHGYAPGSSVCLACEYHPYNVDPKHQPCDYYESRSRAQIDSRGAQMKMHDYPIILSTHAGFIAAQDSGGGQFGKFWPCDLLLMDEDPTESFEPTVWIDEKHANFASGKPEDRAADTMAALLRAAIKRASEEREAMKTVGWKDKAGEQSPVHGKNGSVYAGAALHKLFASVATSVGQIHGIRSAVEAFRDVSDSHVKPAAGALFGATTPASVNMIVPPFGLARIGELLFEEKVTRDQVRRHIYTTVHGKEPHGMQGLSDRVEDFDTAYRVRLEYSRGEWKFVAQELQAMSDQGVNIVAGDAYAHVGHYREIFDKPASIPNDPNYQDPVTVCDRIARFPSGTVIQRILVKSNISYLRDEGEGWQEHAAILSEVLKSLSGRVLIYGHLSLRDSVVKLFEEHDNFGFSEWAYEHWWGGRGKDHYRDYDAVVCISEPTQNMDGTLHKANARATREAGRALVHGRKDDAARELQRITSVMPKTKSKGGTSLAHLMKSAHWRVVREHDRQNVNELSQAIHRVRGLISPKTMIILGSQTELTRDTIASAVTLVPMTSPVEGKIASPAADAADGSMAADMDSLGADTASKDDSTMCKNATGANGKLVDVAPVHGAQNTTSTGGYMSLIRYTSIDGSISESEAYTMMRAVLDHYGVWSPAFMHALLAMEVCELSTVGAGAQGLPCKPLYIGTLYKGLHGNHGLESPSGLLGSENGIQSDVDQGLQSPSDPGGGLPSKSLLGLVDRVWSPPARWSNLNEVAQRGTRGLKRAQARMVAELPCSYWHRPVWLGSRPGRGYAWHSEDPKGGLKFVEIMKQYGPQVRGRLVTSNGVPF
jgi:hypothetical protein